MATRQIAYDSIVKRDFQEPTEDQRCRRYHDYKDPDCGVKSHNDTGNTQREEGFEEAIHVSDIEIEEPSGRLKHQSSRDGHTEDDGGQNVLKEGRRESIDVARIRQGKARTLLATPRGGNQKRWSRWNGSFVDLTAPIAALGYRLVEIR